MRFGSDLWEALEEECLIHGVSVAQFVREAALARVMYLAGRRGDTEYERALELSGAELEPTTAAGERARSRSRQLREEGARRREAY